MLRWLDSEGSHSRVPRGKLPLPVLRGPVDFVEKSEDGGRSGVVEFLIAKGADVNAKSKKVVTPRLPSSRRTVRRLIG